MDRVECVVVGAGVVGLAVARALALRGREVVLLEGERAIGTGTSSRNSGVLHAGLYDDPVSLKARLCVRGNHLLYGYCEQRGVPHRRCGKWIVATDESQLERLQALQDSARANGVALQWRGADHARALEPQLRCKALLDSVSTGIVDSHALMLALQGDFENAGGLLVLASPVLGGDCGANGTVLRVGGEEPSTLCADLVVNSAGLGAQRLASSLQGLASQHVPPLHLAKGSYFSLSGRSPFSRLIYPVPEPGGLGVHLTIDLGGQARFGPDVQWVDALDYQVEAQRAQAFYAAVRRYWPALPDGALQPAYAGIRPKLRPAGGGAADFLVQGPRVHGVPGLVNLFGIESPGLTAALALAEEVVAAVD